MPRGSSGTGDLIERGHGDRRALEDVPRAGLQAVANYTRALRIAVPRLRLLEARLDVFHSRTLASAFPPPALPTIPKPAETTASRVVGAVMPLASPQTRPQASSIAPIV